MNRKEFLRNMGIVTVSAVAAPALAKSLLDEPTNQELLDRATCTAVPEETAGPYPAPGTISTSTLVRSEITEGTQDGIPLTLTFKIVNADDACSGVSGLRVDIWHCNKRGYYSAYDDQPGIDGTQDFGGTTWLRGIQYTDSNGEVTFTSIYPGWYTPRATHVHIQVFNGTTLVTTSQLAFPDSINTTVNAYYATSGTNSFTNTNDMVFSDSYSDELMDVTGDTSAGYVAYKEVAVSGTLLGISATELETGGQFGNLNNYPNPFSETTTVSFNLVQPSDVTLFVFDTTGRLIDQVELKNLTAGSQNILLNTSYYADGIYTYRLKVTNLVGTFSQSKKMIKNT
ncbi:MAG: T9SS type A sorting domain-containing protein [Bacteroidetes bacterium]|nr:T9SS type A sorting domain-containing protein [Bacteroidota bacterium]